MAVSQDFIDGLKHGTYSQRADFIHILSDELNALPTLSCKWVVLVDHPERMASQSDVTAVWPTTMEVSQKARTMPVWFEHNAVQEVLKWLVAAVIGHIVEDGWKELMPGTTKICVLRTNSLEIVYLHEFNQVKATVVFEVQG